MERQEMKQIIKEYLLENFLFGFNEDEVSDDASLMEMGILDSTGIMEVIAFLEQRFEIRIKDIEIIPENLSSIDAISAFVASKK